MLGSLSPGPKRLGGLLQVQYEFTGAIVTGSTQFQGAVDLVPQSTWGDQYLSVAIKPKSFKSTLLLEVCLLYTMNTNDSLSGAFFQQGVANGFGTCANWVGSGGIPTMLIGRAFIPSPGIAPVVYNFRAGPNTGGTTTMNGISGSRIFGGASGSSMSVKEFL